MKLSLSPITQMFVFSAALFSCDSAADPVQKSNIDPTPIVVANPVAAPPPTPAPDNFDEPSPQSIEKQARGISHDILNLGIDLGLNMIRKDEKKDLQPI
ncbi:hypothetical protein HUT03_04495 [Candidatus Liberibacter africanus]|uniref:Uncharacterized protein n=1 Tax=Candidatus Liberibacter africanus PTSAPSY TaxID=1277257 RepID=A0A0G3I7I6_LIBAF|nr:hypothetical protein [Candidatus Liberibacter africanus]AKK20498.1 hypothetical protein G293_04415 [Candidatus Liberibacter africanus PTSAPSY]QTP64212.1 hypothetical protein HUT03_04495 [Candidatus Liberibacter africanus]